MDSRAEVVGRFKIRCMTLANYRSEEVNHQMQRGTDALLTFYTCDCVSKFCYCVSKFCYYLRSGLTGDMTPLH